MKFYVNALSCIHCLGIIFSKSTKLFKEIVENGEFKLYYTEKFY